MTSPTPLPPIEVGTRLTDFASLDLIVEGGAEGGFGLVVWGPNQANGNQMSALKLPRPDLLASANAQSTAEGERMRREFEREALTWCHLWPHPAIITADALTRLPGWDHLPVLILEYAPRGSLRQKVTEAHKSRDGIIPLRTALAWGQQVAAALAVIHQPDPACERPEPLIHCDLKPENVLVNAQGWAKLTDLGLTRAYAAATVAAPTGVAVASLPDSAVAAQADGQAASERDTRVARMRAALQAAGLLTTSSDDPTATAAFPIKGGAAPGTSGGLQTWDQLAGRDAEFQTRSVRVPPISAALLATVLAPRRAESSPGTMPQPGLATEPGIGSRGPVAGTPPYMAPEQWWGLDAVTPASDVYALGVVLFELFAGGRWSRQQQRWLDDAEHTPEATNEPGAPEYYVRFPHAPQFSDAARLFAESGGGGLAGQQAYFAAWYTAHCAGPQWRLADPAVGALTRGPLADLDDDGAPSAQAAQQALLSLSDLVASCLAPVAAHRPTAAVAQRRLGEIARLLGQEPLVMPDVYPRTTAHEAGFWDNLAITYSNTGQYEERLRLERRAVALDPDEPQRWVNLGVAFSYLKRHEEALAAFTEAEKRLTPAFHARDPRRAAQLALILPNNQANTLGDIGRYEEAVAAYRRVLALRPDWADTRFNLAITLVQWSDETGATREQRLERLQAALREIRQVLTEAPTMVNGQALLGQIERAVARLRGA